MSPRTVWKSPPSALHSRSITVSIFGCVCTGNSDGLSRSAAAQIPARAAGAHGRMLEEEEEEEEEEKQEEEPAEPGKPGEPGEPTQRTEPLTLKHAHRTRERASQGRLRAGSPGPALS
ncbi:unnamed protein product [Pleuronectes platessa]|uniref:Uncharacterized protein n=1 Tax=Pleuronectes platessa TaxID=8262 RepID=A0A9N7TYF5_PLEPL|nr:unnamed protein product [Pleuronectes platessa]